MTITITNPVTGSKHSYNGFVPLTRITKVCEWGQHGSCVNHSPAEVVKWLDFKTAKEAVCLCSCHSDEWEKMIARRVSIGFDRAGSLELLAEIYRDFAEKNIPYALEYNQFITHRQAENMA
jgi:midasin (ATPase involved in ribosome maturation)